MENGRGVSDGEFGGPGQASGLHERAESNLQRKKTGEEKTVGRKKRYGLEIESGCF